MAGCALYKRPGENLTTLVEQLKDEPQELSSYTAITGKEGFVFAPFAISEDCPVMVISADRVEQMPVAEVEKVSARLFFLPDEQAKVTNEREQYSHEFSLFHRELSSKRHQKLVLSRSTIMQKEEDVTPLHLFRQACERYPQQFVALISTPRSGTWLMATPEILLEKENSRWHTMALAGTMKAESQQAWSEKNIREQQLVASYIKKSLTSVAEKTDESSTDTIRAGRLQHLQTDFRFTPLPQATTGMLIDALHPTPAVCGLPKLSARNFILQNEQSGRRYYSGFAGPLSLGGETRLYVSLRCMEIFSHSYRLYAGGGLLEDSREEQEWEETEAKMTTMKSLLYV